MNRLSLLFCSHLNFSVAYLPLFSDGKRSNSFLGSGLLPTLSFLPRPLAQSVDRSKRLLSSMKRDSLLCKKEVTFASTFFKPFMFEKHQPFFQKRRLTSPSWKDMAENREEIDYLNKVSKELDLKLDIHRIKKRNKDFLVYVREKAFKTALELCKNEGSEIIFKQEELFSKLRNRDGETLFLAVVREGNAKLVKRFLKNETFSGNGHIDFLGRNAFHLAAVYGHCSLIREFESRFSSECKNGISVLRHAIAHDQEKVLELLLNKNLEDHEFYKIVAQAVVCGSYSCLDYISKEFNGKIREFVRWRRKGSTILHFSVMAAGMNRFSDKDDLIMLSPSFKTIWRRDRQDTLKALIKMNVATFKEIVNERDSDGNTAMHLAVEQGSKSMIRSLYGLGADLGLLNEEGRSCVHLAAENLKQDVINLLFSMDSGINLKRRDKKGLSPLDLVEKGERGDHTRNCLKSLTRLQQKEGPQFSQIPPENIVFEGGGVRGIVHIGVLKALKKLQKLNNIKRVAGTSAGGITAALFASGYSPVELEEIFIEKDFTAFLTLSHPLKMSFLNKKNSKVSGLAKIIQTCWKNSSSTSNPFARAKNLYKQLWKLEGIFDGKDLRDWIDNLIEKKTEKQNCTFKELENLSSLNSAKYKELSVFAVRLRENNQLEAVRLGTGKPKYDNLIIADAVRCSIAIPGVFERHILKFKDEEGKIYERRDLGKYFDGGILKNFPLDIYDHFSRLGDSRWGVKSNSKTLGVSLAQLSEKKGQKAFDKSENKTNLIKLVDAIIHFEKSLSLENSFNKDRVIEVPTGKLEVLDTSMSQTKKRELIKKGSDAAQEFFSNSR